MNLGTGAKKKKMQNSSNIATLSLSEKLEKSLQLLNPLFNEMELEYLSNKLKFILSNDYIQTNTFVKDSFFVKSYSNQIPHITTVVSNSLGKSTCSCQKFKFKKICPHLIATLITRNRLTEFVEHFISKSSKSSKNTRIPSKQNQVKNTNSKTKVSKPTVKRETDKDFSKNFSILLKLLTSDSTFRANDGEDDDTTECLRRKDGNYKFAKAPKNPSCIHPFTICKLSKRISVCYGCKDQLHNPLPGFNSIYDKEYCLSRFQEYYFYNKTMKKWQLGRGYKHFHISFLCTSAGGFSNKQGIAINEELNCDDNFKKILELRFPVIMDSN